MLTIGLTGGIGSGKTQVSDQFAQLGVTVIDTDIIARELVAQGQPALSEITARFGEQLLDTEGDLDRHALRHLIFNQPDKRQQLEEILHPRIRAEVKKRVAALERAWCIIVIPLLVESRQQDLIQRVLLIDAPEELQLSRSIARDHVEAREVEKIIATQASRKSRLEAADDIIVNQGSLEQLQQQVMKMYQFYNTLSSSCQTP